MQEQKIPNTISPSETSTFREVLTRIVHTDKFKDALFVVAGIVIGIGTSLATNKFNIPRWIHPLITAGITSLIPGLDKLLYNVSANIDAITREEPQKFDTRMYRREWFLVLSSTLSSTLMEIAGYVISKN